jgi:dUTP pyrophosphatase
MSELDKNINEEDFDEIMNLLDSFDEDEEIDLSELSSFLGIDFNELQNDIFKDSVLLSLNFSKSNEDAIDPQYAYPTDSGFDLYSTKEVWIDSFGRELIPTGIHIDVPENYEIQVRSKSGLALKQGLMVLNSPGTIDQGYTGEIQVILFNTSKEKVKIEKGQKVAQAVLCPVVAGKWIKLIPLENIEDKDRNNNGFGSTGV